MIVTIAGGFASCVIVIAFLALLPRTLTAPRVSMWSISRNLRVPFSLEITKRTARRGTWP